ncbi:uncharacterized protein LOC111359856 [Spodoptera litura]|uniref:Uncharacterized protein LOC111359856 n=2 Tax=Spodoptera litura TaxID=69820 RepID=A0A9J7EII3_SPOLT|nr:uncharacterized protein LOC111359856 [Spodoptera litura]
MESNNKNKSKTPEEERASELSSLAVGGESQGGSGTRGEALESSSQSLTRALSRRMSEAESDYSSASGAYSLRSLSSQRQKKGTFKRPRLKEGRDPSSNEQEAPAPKIPTAARGRGRRKGCERPMAATRAESAEADSSESGGEGSVGDLGAINGDLCKVVKQTLRTVAEQKSEKGRNGVLRQAKAAIMKAARQCGLPSAAGQQMAALQKELGEMRREMIRLTASNAAMEDELRSAKAELAAAREGRPRASQPVEADIIGLVRREMAAFQQRFDVLESRILRPPLAGSQAAPRTFAAAAAMPTTPGRSSGVRAQPPAASPAQASAETVVRAPTVRRRGGAVPGPSTAPAVEPTRTSGSPASGGGWQVVGEARRVAKEGRKRRKKEQRQRQRQRRKEKRAAAMLVAPKTAAVVITLQPDAVKRGVTYGDILAKLKQAVTPAEYGAPNGFSLKVTATGARLLEVPGATSGPTADALAERLRVCLGADEARVSRPTKCLELRIMGLDDSVTEEEVVAAVARTGECPAEQVKTGTIRPDNSGLRTVVVSCPVSAAKKIKEGRRLLVGWVSAQVKLLEVRPIRCFRCHVGDHVSARCTSEVDRSDCCFRCGQPGHRAGSCSAPLHCHACAAVGKPANHRVGSKACSPPAKSRGKGRPSAVPVSPAPAAAVATNAVAAATTGCNAVREEAGMDCQ